MRMDINNNDLMHKDIFFISDAHIGTRDNDAEILKEKRLKSFFAYLTTVSPPPLLYIVGDLFDFWFEYRFAIPAVYQKLLTRLVYLNENGIEVRFVTGNHDFWIRNFFQKYLNIQVYHGVHTLQVNSKSFYIFHGDGVLKVDKGYRILKRIIQNPFVIMLYKWIHPDIGIPLARWSSAMSRDQYKKNPGKVALHDEKYVDFASQILKSDFDYILLGHTHRPMIVTNGSKTYINLGDWIQHFTFAKFDGKKLGLYQWTEKNKKNASGCFVETKPIIKQFK